MIKLPRVPRLRLVPLTIFAAALTLTVKIGDVWTGVGGFLNGTLAISKAEAQQQQGRAAEPAPAPTKPAQTPRPPTPLESPKTAAAPAAPPASAPATPAPRSASRPSPIDDPTLFTQAEIDLLQNLAERREKLEQREREIEQRAGLLKAAETRIDQKVEEMKTLKTTIEKLLKSYDKQEEQKVASLVKIYENMKPRDAARIFEELEMDTLLLVAERMAERRLAPVMAQMNPAKAKEVTVELARLRRLPRPTAGAGG
jgi:flagellar motility protein MotE (MotC chaperone)